MVSADTSSFGLGAALLQVHGDAAIFFSRTLTETVQLLQNLKKGLRDRHTSSEKTCMWIQLLFNVN